MFRAIAIRAPSVVISTMTFVLTLHYKSSQTKYVPISTINIIPTSYMEEKINQNFKQCCPQHFNKQNK